MRKKKLLIKNNAKDGVPEVSIRGDIGEYDGAYIASSIDSFSGDYLRININSYGGLIDEAFSIVTAMTKFINAGGTIETINEGRADSCAGWIFSCGSRGYRKIMSFAEMFFHPPQLTDGTTIETAIEGSDTQKTLLSAFDKLIGIFTAATDKAESYIRSIMSDETNMSATEAVKAGFADEVLQVRNQPPVKQNLSRKEFVTVINCSDYEPEIITSPDSGHKPINNMKKIAIICNLNPEASEDAVEAEVVNLKDGKVKAEAEVVNLKQDLAVATARAEKAENKLKEITETEVVNYVDKLIEADASKKEHKEALLSMANMNFAAFKAINPIQSGTQQGVNLNGGIDPDGNADEKKKIKEDADKFATMSNQDREALKVSNQAEYTRLISAYEKA